MEVEIANSMLFTFSAFLYSILIYIVFISKKKVKTFENVIYTIILTAVVLLLFVNLILFLITSPTFSLIIRKINQALLLFIGFSLSYYFIASTSKKNMGYVSIKENENKDYFLKIAKTTGIMCGSAIFISLFLPYTDVDGLYIEAKGIGALYTYSVFAILIIYWFYLLFKADKNKQKQFIPIIFSIIVGALGTFLQLAIPNLYIINAVVALGIDFVFFSIGNPDLRMIEELNMAKDGADRANKAKSDFLSSMSHEIRTPLNAIVGFSESLFEEELDATSKEDVNIINSSAISLLEIVNGILDISKMDAGKLEVTNRDYILNKMINDVTIASKKYIEGKKLDLKINVSEELPQVLNGDVVKLKSIITNLLTNAIKYTNEGTIILNVDGIIKNNNCRLIIYVEDSGIGMNKQTIENLFTSYQQSITDKSAAPKGTGLGVAVTKKLVELMGGKIHVRSAEGIGSSFIFALDQKIIAKTSNEVEGLYTDELKIFDLTGNRVMVVDDNGVNLKVAKRLLKEYKLDVDLKQSGQECIDSIKLGEKYDLIMMDDFMPVMNGTQTLNGLKEIGGFNTPVIALTANNESSSKDKYMSLGFNGYLAKPIAKEELNKTLKEFLT